MFEEEIQATGHSGRVRGELSSKAAYGRHDVAPSELCVRKGSSGTLGNRTPRDPDSEQGEEETFKSGDASSEGDEISVLARCSHPHCLMGWCLWRQVLLGGKLYQSSHFSQFLAGP